MATSLATIWFYSMVSLLGLTLALYHLGVNATGDLGAALHNAEHLLGQPLLAF